MRKRSKARVSAAKKATAPEKSHARKTTARRPAATARIPAAVLREMNQELDRYIKRWLRRLLITDEHGVRHLTEEEVEMASAPPAKKRTRRRTRV